MKSWAVEKLTNRGTLVRGQATLADGKITVTRNGDSASVELLGDPHEEAVQLLMELYVMALKRPPPGPNTKQ